MQEPEEMQADDHDQRNTGQPKDNVTSHSSLSSMLSRRRFFSSVSTNTLASEPASFD